MLQLVCFTCNKLFADFHIDFEQEKAKIETNRNLSANEKMKQINELLDKFHVKRYCCRSRVLTYVKQVDILI